ncbi:hypothetical protein ACLIBG_05080 [Virgibacillus sp. W0181]|uniref:hypothetical protein n=1 Tax=Virgibacillus sp. W0181 TaxID=3391581 RepID=UPI003F4589BA
MKRKVIILVVLAFVFGGSVTYAAAKNYYADLLANQQQQMQDEILKHYKKEYQDKGTMQHRDIVTTVEQKRQEVLTEVKEYAKSKVHNDANDRREEHTKAIQAEADRMVKELKAFVDRLGDEEGVQ